MSLQGKSSGTDDVHTADDEASELFVQRLYGQWTSDAQTAFEVRLERDLAFAQAWQRVEQSWASLGRLAEVPEVMTYRAAAIAEVRRANARRCYQAERMSWLAHKWQAAAAIAGLALLGGVWQFSPYGYRPGQYRTDIGEQRIVELEDHSRITMDAATRLQVRFSSESRTIRLIEGQAHFSVAKDTRRPFKVLAGDRTVIAVGTVFTVEHVNHKVHIAMLEGEVAVLSPAFAHQSPNTGTGAGKDLPTGERQVVAVTLPKYGHAIEGSKSDSVEEIFLTAGEELYVARDGQTTVTPTADLESVTAWREGKVILRAEPLGEAVSRMNRYSRLQLQIVDPSLASKRISGVFEAGDTRGFVSALQRYLPVTADYMDDDTVRLRAR